MFFARYYPGLGITGDVLSAMTPEETRAMRRVGLKILKAELNEQWQHTKIIAQASGMRVR
jgi:hypothetical protein